MTSDSGRWSHKVDSLLSFGERLLRNPPTLLYGVDDAVLLARDFLRTSGEQGRDDDTAALLRFGLRFETCAVSFGLALVGLVAQLCAGVGVFLTDASSAARVLTLACLFGAILMRVRSWLLLGSLLLLVSTAGPVELGLITISMVSQVIWARFHAEVGLLLGGPRVSVLRVLAVGATFARPE